MFNFFKKHSPTPSVNELQSLSDAAIVDVKKKWVYFHETIHLKKDVPLSKKMDLFVEPILEFFKTKYSALLQGSTEIFWLTVFTAILESETHQKDEVNVAIEELRKKYMNS